MSRFVAWSLDAALPIVERWKDVEGGLLPMSVEIQSTFGYIDTEVIQPVADALNLSRAEVVGFVDFYHDFRKTPPAAHQLRICLAEACQAAGGNALSQHLSQTLGALPGERSADGEIDVDAVYCLGNCGLSPAVMLDGKTYGRMTAARADSLLEGIRG
ncbi:MAG: NAD(P)H-dependent oxidoreductase subunit E [Dehalococcoidia bacterium]|nr:NAD(P)H-dependent oxidoreductase subunit E [Dehalococcoidia bacterium]